VSYVLIIGSRSDLGRALAREYAKQGYDLYLASRRADEDQEFADDIRIRYERQAHCVSLDVLDFAAHQGFFDMLDEKPIGAIAVAGYLGVQEESQSDFEETKKVIDTNFTGIVSLLNIVANDFEKRGCGFIVGISSVAGDRGRQSNYIYGAAKGALSVYLAGLRNRLFASDVHVLTVKPGFMNTKMTMGMDLPGVLTAQPEDVASAIFRAQKKRKNVLYVKWIWRWIMLAIRNVPEFHFKKMNI
jgi:short-subunit dehydrogenase